MMSKITARIHQSTVDWLEAISSSKTSGAEYILDAFPVLYQRCLRSLRGKFSRGELLLILDALNGLFPQASLAGQFLVLEVSDSISLNRLDEKWEIYGDALVDKIVRLTNFEATCLELWGMGFWSSGTYQEDQGEDKWMEPLLDTTIPKKNPPSKEDGSPFEA